MITSFITRVQLYIIHWNTDNQLLNKLYQPPKGGGKSESNNTPSKNSGGIT